MSSTSLSDQFPSGDTYSHSSRHIYDDVDSTSGVGLLGNKTPSNSTPSVEYQGHQPSRVVTIVTVVSLTFSVLSLLIVGLLCGWVFLLNDGDLLPKTWGLKGEEKKTEVCVPCLQISPNPLETSASSLWQELDVRFDKDKVTEICCATSSAQFAILFKLILQRQQAVKKLADSLDGEARKKNESDDVIRKDEVSDKAGAAAGAVGVSAASAHLVFKPRQVSRSGAGHGTETETLTLQQQWKSPAESPMSHVREGLQFLKNQRVLVVNTPGRYYVYCQFLYSPTHHYPNPSDASSDDGRRRDNNNDLVVSAYVRRYSVLRPSAPTFLLKMRHTRPDDATDRHSGYTGGVFRLHPGDWLYVQVSRPELVSYDEVGSFFGLFRVGD